MCLVLGFLDLWYIYQSTICPPIRLFVVLKVDVLKSTQFLVGCTFWFLIQETARAQLPGSFCQFSLKKILVKTSFYRSFSTVYSMLVHFNDGVRKYPKTLRVYYEISCSVFCWISFSSKNFNKPSSPPKHSALVHTLL